MSIGTPGRSCFSLAAASIEVDVGVRARVVRGKARSDLEEPAPGRVAVDGGYSRPDATDDPRQLGPPRRGQLVPLVPRYVAAARARRSAWHFWAAPLGIPTRHGIDAPRHLAWWRADTAHTDAAVAAAACAPPPTAHSSTTFVPAPPPGPRHGSRSSRLVSAALPAPAYSRFQLSHSRFAARALGSWDRPSAPGDWCTR